jgi:hypothetical protein
VVSLTGTGFGQRGRAAWGCELCMANAGAGDGWRGGDGLGQNGRWGGVGVVNGGPRCGWRIPTVAGMAYEAGVAPPAFATYQLQLRPLWLGSRPGGSHSTSMPKFHLFSCRSLFRSHFLFLFIFFLVSCLRKSRLEAFMQLNVKIT